MCLNCQARAAVKLGEPDRSRTYGTRFRKPLLYPLSYWPNYRQRALYHIIPNVGNIFILAEQNDRAIPIDQNDRAAIAARPA